MERYLMTHSLLSSWLYALKDNPYEVAGEDDKLTAYDEFLLTLRRIQTPTNEAMQKGIDFEDLVTRIVGGYDATYHKWYDPAAKIAGIVKGGVLQCRATKQTVIRNIPVFLYGRIDALKAGVVHDIKFSGSYETGKYISSTQHPMYMELVPQATAFTYLVSNGEHMWPETYTREEIPSIYPTISGFFDWLDIRGLMSLYKEKWQAL